MLKTNHFIIFFIVPFFIMSCNDNTTLKYHLAEGLKEYKFKRPVNEKLNQDFFIEEIAFFKHDSVTYDLIFKLKNPVKVESALKYSMAIHAFVNKEFLNDRNDYLLLDYKPEVKSYKTHNYFIKKIKTKAKRIDSLDFFLFHRDKYRGLLGRKITVRNIGL